MSSVAIGKNRGQRETYARTGTSRLVTVQLLLAVIARISPFGSGEPIVGAGPTHGRERPRHGSWSGRSGREVGELDHCWSCGRGDQRGPEEDHEGTSAGNHCGGFELRALEWFANK
jgi:hypothetical protein